MLERKINEFNEKMKNAKTPDDYIKARQEMRIYSEGVIATETNPVWKAIGTLFLSSSISEENFMTLIKVMGERLKSIEDRLQKIEKEMSFFRENR